MSSIWVLTLAVRAQALLVCGEQPMVPPIDAIGFAYLSYDSSAVKYVQDVKNVRFSALPCPCCCVWSMVCTFA
jgi:hypothetical protein